MIKTTRKKKARKPMTKKVKQAKRETVCHSKVNYIVVHSNVQLNAIEKDGANINPYPYPVHYIVRQNGELINLKPLQPTDGTIDVALEAKGDGLLSGIRQNEALMNVLTLLSDAFPEAKVISAKQSSGDASRQFDLTSWLENYIRFIL